MSKLAAVDRQVQLKELSPMHMQVMALLAQGVPRQNIAKICEITPEYVTWLTRDPLCVEYLKKMSEFTQIRMEALFESSVDAIADTLQVGSEDSKLKAAKLQLEATGRIGRSDRIIADPGQPGRLEVLAERLVGLLHQQRRRVLDGQATEVSEGGQTGAPKADASDSG